MYTWVFNYILVGACHSWNPIFSLALAKEIYPHMKCEVQLLIKREVYVLILFMLLYLEETMISQIL